MKADNMKKFLLALFFVPLAALAAGGAVPLDTAPDVQGDQAALQNGARLFEPRSPIATVSCALQLLYRARPEQQIKDNLMSRQEKVIRVAARSVNRKHRFGVAAGSSLVARARASATAAPDGCIIRAFSTVTKVHG
jgi:ubiquinol-cytochrome c reductase cytochrome c1 subunit